MKRSNKTQKLASLITFNLKILFEILFILPSKSFRLIKLNFKDNKIKVIIISLVSMSILSLALMFIFISFIHLFPYSKNNVSNISTEKIIPRGGDTTQSEDQIKATNTFLDAYDLTIGLLKPLLDNFVGTTADVSSEGRIQFTDNTSIISPISFYNLSFSLAIGILSLLLVSLGINFMLNEEEINYKSILTRLISVIIFLVAGRLLLSFSIQLINGTNELIRNSAGNGASLTDYMHQFVQSIKAGVPKDESNNILYALRSGLLFHANNTLGVIQSLPIIIPLILILVMLLFISFQFIFRFISLYFLVVLQPIAAIFLLHDKTRNINSNFWRNWITLLIHQPAFILGYALIQAILLDMLKTGPNFAGIIIFLVSLLFLSTVGVLVGRIFGDAWTAIANTTSSKNALRLVSGGFRYLNKEGHNFRRNRLKNIGNNPRGKDLSYINNHGRSSLPTLQSSKNLNNKIPKTGSKSLKVIEPTPLNKEGKEIKDYSFGNHEILKDALGSGISKAAVEKGYSLAPTLDANSNQTGIVKYSGSFFKSSNSDGTSTLYTSQKEAIEDGRNPNLIQKIKIKDLPILDTSNRKELSEYNAQISRIRSSLISKGQTIGDTHLKGSGTSSRDRIANAMTIGREVNKMRNIKGIAVQRYGTNTSKLTNASRQIQLHVYDEDLEKK